MIEQLPDRTPPAMTIRSGGADDLDRVMEIMGAAFPARFGEAWTRSQCAGILPMAGVMLTLAETEGAVAGFSLMRAVADEAELLLIAVDPAIQHHGIGRSLVSHFVADARRRGAHRLHLEVREDNTAVSLYAAAGFEPVGRRRDYYRGTDGDRYDAVTLMLAQKD